MTQKISITLAVLPFCNHPKFDNTCLACVDAQRVYNDLRKLQEKTKSDRTKIQVLSGIGGNKLV